MTIYGTKIISDIDFPLDLSQETEALYGISLSSGVSDTLKSVITCGFRFLWAHGRNCYLYSDREFNGSQRGQPWCCEIENVVKFYWYGGEQTVYYALERDVDSEQLSFWFVHIVFPLYAMLERIYDFLHAGAVEIDSKAILFIAPSMGGKSTMTDYFLKQGHGLISDDKVPIFEQNNRWMLVGAHPYHRPYRKNEDLGYRAKKYSSGFKKLETIYILKKQDKNAQVSLKEIKGFAKIDLVLPNFYNFFRFWKVDYFSRLTDVLNKVQVVRVDVPWDTKRLQEVYMAICKHKRGNEQ